MTGDVLAIAGCLLLLYLQKGAQLPSTPRFSNLILYNVFTAVNLVFCGYYFGGSEFSFNPKNGVFGLLTS
jgi:hypothetical protein